MLLSLIPEQQNGFVPSRQILNSIISVHENIHSLSLSKNQGFIMKVDIAKAYERVEWDFLENILLAFGFSTIIVKLILQMISTTLIAVLVNGCSSEFFSPSRGF